MLFALGFVFMFTIGGLLIHLALPLKATKCEELLTIMLLVYYLIIAVKMPNFEQSAGNLLILFLKSILVGTPETKRSPKSIRLFEDIVRVIKQWLIYLYIPNLKHSIIRPYSILNSNFFCLPSSVLLSPTDKKEGTAHGSFEGDNKNKLNPVKVYNSLKQCKVQILKDQKDKCGVYCLINNINGHNYIGSSINLASRMRNYLNNTFLKSKENINMPIIKALLKYDQLNFTLLILEYVEPEFLAIRETFYITHIIPYYNVLKQGYSSLGYKHTEETKKLLSELAKNRVHSDKTKALIARAVTGENNPFYNRSHSVESKIRMIEANSAYPVYVYNSFKNLLVIYPSVSTLAKLIKSNHPTLVNIIKEQKIFRGEWYLSNIPFNLTDTPSISDWSNKECDELVLKMNKNSDIIKAVFVYDTDKNFLGKYDGVMSAQRALKISHCTIKKCAHVCGTYKGYIFSYERLKD